VVLVIIVAASSYYQQKQIQGRNPSADIPQQQQMLMKLMPAMFVVIAFVAPSALVVYFVVSNLYRIGQQHYITRTLYHGEDSLGAQAQRAAVESKKLKDEHGAPELLPGLKRKNKGGETPSPEAKRLAATSATEPTSSNGNGKTGGTTAGGPRPTPPQARSSANRSKKKKKRR
jgi:YidC/Oxa1 family membrane protein insertase